MTPAAADPGEPTAASTNPDLTKACGLDVAVILDESGSIATSNATNDVRRAFIAFVDSLNNTGSAMAVVEFSTVARLPSIGGAPGGTYVTIEDGTEPAFINYINNGYVPNNRTNWEDALRVARYFAPRPDPAIPHLVVFITDGDPTAVINNSQVTPTEYKTKVPLSDNETTSVSGNAGVTPAIPNANALKADGSHILAIGVGAALQNPSSAGRLVQIAGPDVFDGTGTFDISTTDVYLEGDFSQLEAALRNAAFQLCAPSVSVRKLYDPTPDPDSLDDAIAGVGWEIDGTVLSVPGPGTFEWVLPNGAPAGTVSAPSVATGVTNGAGFVTFQWTPTDPDGDSGFQLTEDTGGNPPDPPGGTYSNVPDETVCTYRTPDTPDQNLPLDALDPGGGFSITIPPESIVTCTLVNLATPAPGIDIEKLTNGSDADTGVGPIIPVGDEVVWQYLVANTGNTTLDDVVVTDSVLGVITCPATTLGVDDSMVCTVTGTAAPGQYVNDSTVTATDSNGIEVDDSDPSRYFGAILAIDVEKATNGQDADEPTGPGINVGDPVDWTYQVSLVPGNVPLEDVSLVDDAGTPTDTSDDFAPTFTGGDAGIIGILETGEVWTYEATGIAVAGQYENFATVSGDPVGPDETQAVDNDPSHYFGVDSAISIQKYTNGADADLITDPDVPVLRVGSRVEWLYRVTNEGNVPIPGWEVLDSELGNVACTREVLAPGSSALCHASGDVVQGEYENIGTVNATDIVGNSLTDSDPSHYIGVLPSIDIQKSTNGDDADLPPGPLVPFPSTVTWEYLVTNTGEVMLTDLQVFDPRLSGATPIACPVDFLDPGDSTTCVATGPAVVGRYRNMAVVVARDPFGVKVADFDPSHYFGVAGGIELIKFTNGFDANDAPGALIPVGGVVEWSYQLTNTGNSALSSVSLVDDQLGSISCPATTLAVGAAMTCTTTGVAARGQYTNTATVTAVDEAEQTVTDSDPSNYFGFLLQIDVEKATNGEDADTPTGPYVPVGDPVTWTYVVTNPGDFYLRDVTLTDDRGVVPVLQGGDADGDTFLDPGEVWTYAAAGAAEPGQYENTATVTGTVGQEFDDVLTDSDPSHYFGLVATIEIDKTPDVAVVELGASHTFDIRVTNTSNVPLTDVEVTDPVTPACDRVIGGMAIGEVVTYSCEHRMVTGFVENTAFVTGLAPDGTGVADDDPAVVTLVGAGGTGAIGDLVWHDDNRNGVQDDGERGIPNARVRVEVDPDTVSMLAAPIGITVTTDQDGRYLAGNLVAGSYTVTLIRSSAPDGVLTTPGTYQVQLASGDVMLDADFGIAGSLPFTGIAHVALLLRAAVFMLAAGAALVLWQRHFGGE